MGKRLTYLMYYCQDYENWSVENWNILWNTLLNRSRWWILVFTGISHEHLQYSPRSMKIAGTVILERSEESQGVPMHRDWDNWAWMIPWGNILATTQYRMFGCLLPCSGSTHILDTNYRFPWKELTKTVFNIHKLFTIKAAGRLTTRNQAGKIRIFITPW